VYLCPPVAILIASFGRHALRTMVKVAEEMGLTPIAGDTDSLFLADMKTKDQFAEFKKRCNDLLKVEDPILKKMLNIEIDNESGGDDSQLPITYKHFWQMKKKHYYYVNTKGEFDSTTLEVEKENNIPYSAAVLWKQWGKDIEDNKNPIENLKRLTSDEELQCILEREPDLLKNSQALEMDPGTLDAETGELINCEYKRPYSTPHVVLAWELGLRKDDIVYYYKTGKHKGQIDEDTGKVIGSYTTNPKYADLGKIKEDIANAFMDVLKVYLGYPIGNDRKVEEKIKREVFGLGY
jgi:hypothetical protein